MSNAITCPHCGHSFSLSDVQKHELEHLREKLSKDLKVDADKRALEWAKTQIEKAKSDADDLAKKQLADNEEKNRKQFIELESLRKRDEESRRKEIEFLREKNALEQRQKDMEIEKERAIMEARKEMEGEVRLQIEKQQSFESEKRQLEHEKQLAEMRKQLEITQKALSDANQKANQ